MAGLLELEDDLVGETPQGDEFMQAGATSYEPELSEVNQPTDTVAGQMETLLSKDSPYMTRARTSAMQYANSRGLVNSSMAAGAGEAAAIDRALPIASQDANTYNATRMANQGYTNRASEFGAGQKNAASQFNAAQGNQLSGMRVAEDIEKSLIGTRTEAQSRLMAEQNDFQRQMAQLNADLQTGQIMPAQFEQQSALMQQQFQQRMAELGFSTQAQQQLVTLQSQLQQDMARLDAALQTGQLMPAQLEMQKALLAAQFQNQVGLMSIQSQLEKDMAQLNADLQTGQLMPAQFEQQKALLEIGAGIQRDTMAFQSSLAQQMAKLNADLQTGQIMPAEFANQKALLEEQLAASSVLQEAQQDFTIALQSMRGEQAMDLANLEGQYKQLLQTNAGAATFFAEMSKGLAAILADPDSSQEQKDNGTDMIADLLRNGLAVMGGISDLDLTSLLDFGG